MTKRNKHVIHHATFHAYNKQNLEYPKNLDVFRTKMTLKADKMSSKVR